MFPGSATGWSRLDGPAGSLVLGAAATAVRDNDFDDVERLLAGLQEL